MAQQNLLLPTTQKQENHRTGGRNYTWFQTDLCLSLGMQDDLLYQLALTMVPNIGDVHAKLLAGLYSNARDIFHAPKKQLEKIEGIGTVRMRSIKSFSNFAACEQEISFIEKY